MRKRVTQLIVCLMLMSGLAFGQGRQIRGTVTSNGEPLPFANVVVKGTTLGVASDLQGNYEITVPQDAKALVFSAVGYKTKVVDITNGTTFNVEMEADVLNLDEVVVTAQAVKREKRSLGYATTELSGQDITQGRDRSVINSLQGKVAGVNITNGSGSPGSSTRIIIRGGSSITGNNQPLIVVDGIPIDNSSFQSADNLNNQVDFGNRANDINPEDIASITVLKGPAAAALYGSRASNGAILITTKNGSSGKKGKKAEIGYTSSYTFEDILKYPEYQNEYGEGGRGESDLRENFSWGPKFDSKVRPWGQEIDGKQRVKPYEALPNNVKDFFDIGHTFTNTLSLSGGDEKASYYASVGDLHNTGVIPTTYYNRTTVKVSGSTQLSNRFSSSASINYFKTNASNSTQGQSFSVYDQVLQTPRDIPIAENKDLTNPFNKPTGYYGAYTLNPYWVLENSSNLNDVDRVLGSLQISYKVADWLDLTARGGSDFYTDRRTQSQLKFDFFNWGFEQQNLGRYSEDIYKVSDITTDLMANIHKDLTKDLNMSVLLGHNIRQSRITYTGASTSGLVIPDFYNLENSNGPIVASNSLSLRRLYGIYADVNFAFRNYLFLGVTARNDWSSTLPKGNNSFFYPGVNASFVFTDALKMTNNKFLSYGKLRASWAQVGNDAGPYLLTTVFQKGTVENGHQNSELNFPFNGVPGYERADRIGNNNLQPEITTASEIGTEISFLKNRLGVDISLYNNKSTNQIINVPISPSSGFRAQTINAGEITNKGIELLVRGTPISTKKGLKWELGFTYTRNKSNVVSLYGDVTQIVLGNPGQAGLSDANVVAAIGKPYGTFYAIGSETDGKGHVVIDTVTGLPVISATPQYYGTYMPDYIMGLTSNLSFKGFRFGFVFDYHKGGQIYARTKDILEFVGVSANTVDANGNRDPFIVPNSVYAVEDANGNVSYVTNKTYKADMQDYYTDQNNSANNLIDATFLKLREVSLSYAIPQKITDKTFFGNIEVGIVGRNLWLRTAKENIFIDPEVSSMGSGNAQGFEFGAIPPIRSWGGELRVTF